MVELIGYILIVIGFVFGQAFIAVTIHDANQRKRLKNDAKQRR